MLHVGYRENDDTMICNVYIIIEAVMKPMMMKMMVLCVCEYVVCVNAYIQTSFVGITGVYFGRHDRFPAVPVEACVGWCHFSVAAKRE